MTLLTVEQLTITSGEERVAVRVLSDRLAEPQLVRRGDGEKLEWRAMGWTGASSHCR